MSDAQFKELAEYFTRFAADCQRMSPFYTAFATAIAEDREILELVSRKRPRQPGANVLFAAVRMLLDCGAEDTLLAKYPTEYRPCSGDGVYPAFRSFLMEHQGEIEEIIGSRTVQANVVRRSAVLLLGLMSVGEQLGGEEFASVEIGASIGLTLLWQRFHYDYGEGRKLGEVKSPVQVATVLTGEPEVLRHATLPRVIRNVGIELEPLDVDDADDVAWLNALIWPEHEDNRQLSSAAIELARLHRPEIVAGDALEVLQTVIADAGAGVPVSVYHSHTLNQFSAEAKKRFQDLLCDASRARRVFRLGFESVGERSALRLYEYRGGSQVDDTELAICEPHGREIEWVAD